MIKTVVTILLTAMLELTDLKEDKNLMLTIQVIMKVTALLVNIAAFGAVWYIAVPLCVFSILLMFLVTPLIYWEHIKKKQMHLHVKGWHLISSKPTFDKIFSKLKEQAASSYKM